MADNIIFGGNSSSGEKEIILPNQTLGNKYEPGTPIEILNPKKKILVLPSNNAGQGISSEVANSRYVRYDVNQGLSEADKLLARTNIGIDGAGLLSSGMLSEPGFADNGDGTIDVAAAQAQIYKTTDWTGGLFKYTIVALANLPLLDNTTNYIIVNYNGGNPVYQSITNVSLINESDVIPVYTIERKGATLHVLGWDGLANGKSDRMHMRFVKTNRFIRDNNEGLAVSEFGTRNLRIETGRVWYGANTIDLSVVDSTIDDFELYFNVSGVWNLAPATQWNNTQYDDGTDLQTITAGKYGVVWLYRGVENDSHGLMVLGNDEYDTEAEARVAGVRSDLPSSINTNSMLVSQLIFLKDAATLSDIRSPFNTIFVSSTPTSHNSLAGLQLAGNSVTYGHIDDQAQSIKGEKTFVDIVRSTNFQSSVVTGTQPYATASTTLNTNLNADLLDGKHATEFAAFDYLDNVDNVQQVPISYLDTDVLLTAASDVRVATQRAIKIYIDGLIDGTLKAPEPYNPTVTSAFPTTYGSNPIEKGDSFRIIAAGTMNGVIVNVEDLLISLIDLPGNTPSNWQVLESNRDQATESILGVAKIATQIEVDAGTDNLSFVTSLKLATALGNIPIPTLQEVTNTGAITTIRPEFSDGITLGNAPSGRIYGKTNEGEELTLMLLDNNEVVRFGLAGNQDIASFLFSGLNTSLRIDSYGIGTTVPFITSSASPLGSSPNNVNANNGAVLTANGAGGSSWLPQADLSDVAYVNVNNNFSATQTAPAFIKSGGLAAEFLKADGSVDNTEYVTISTSQTISGRKVLSGLSSALGTGSNTHVFTFENSDSLNNRVTGVGFYGNVPTVGSRYLLGEILYHKYPSSVLTYLTLSTKNTAGLDNILRYDHRGQLFSNDVEFQMVEIDWYGVEWDSATATTECVRIGNLDMHKTLPIHNERRRCLVWDNGTVHYYLDPNDSNLKEDGTASVLDGTDGQVMVENPKNTYISHTINGTIHQFKISKKPLDGFTKIPNYYIGALEASLNRSTGKLYSIYNTGVDYRGGNNTSAWDLEGRTLLGIPATNLTRNEFRVAASLRGDKWHIQLKSANAFSAFLYIIEYANLNSQLAYNPTLTVDGYKQGGLGVNNTNANSTEWSNYNSFNPVLKNNLTFSLGNNTGIAATIISDFGGLGIDRTFEATSYRGEVNIFGHIWKFIDGLNVLDHKAYVTDNLTSLVDDTSNGYESIGLFPSVNGFQTDFMDNNLLLPSSVSGNSISDFYFQSTGWRVSLVGGALNAGSVAGLFALNVTSSSAGRSAYIGARLCFLAD